MAESTEESTKEKSTPEAPPMETDKSPLGGLHRLSVYKSRVISVAKIRAKRAKEEVQLRKERRYDQLIKRRVISSDEEIQPLKKPSEPQPEENDNRPVNANEKEPEKEADKEKSKEVDEQITENMPLDQLTNIVMEGVGERRLKAVIVVRRLLSRHDPPIDEVISTGVIPHLVDCVSPEEDEKLQMEAAWALTNIASGNSEQTATVVNGGCIPRFIQLLHAPSEFVREQVVWGIANISGDCAEFRDLVLDFGIIEVLDKMMEDGSESLKIKKQGAWLLSNICRHKDYPLQEETISSLLPVFLNGFMYHEDKEILKDLCWGLSYLTENGDTDVVQQVLDSGVMEYIVDIMEDVAHSAIRFVGNITTGTDSQTQVIVDCGGVVKLKVLLEHYNESVQKEACWALSNITAGTVDQKQAVINNGCVPILFDIITSDARSIKIKKEAFWAITNITEGATDRQISYLIGLGIIVKLIEALKLQVVEIMEIALDGLAEVLSHGERVVEEEGEEAERGNPYSLMILESPELVDQLEALQHHENQSVIEKASKILDTYITPLEDKLKEREMGRVYNKNRLQENKNKLSED